jgi:hypothetical protein
VSGQTHLKLSGPWVPAPREWLDLVDGQGHSPVSFDGWRSLMAALVAGRLEPGWYTVWDADRAEVAAVAIGTGGRWRMHGRKRKESRS